MSRRLLSRSWNLLTRAILNLDFTDTQCGAKLFRSDAILKILHQVALTNWAFDVSLLFHLTRSGFQVKEVPVSWNAKPDSKLRVQRVVPTMFLSLIGVRLMNSEKMRPIAVLVAWRLRGLFRVPDH